MKPSRELLSPGSFEPSSIPLQPEPLLTRLAHEFRSPLNVMLGYAQLLYDEGHGDAEDHDAATEIMRAGLWLNRLVDDLRDLADLMSGRIQVRATAQPLALLVDAAVQDAVPLLDGCAVEADERLRAAGPVLADRVHAVPALVRTLMVAQRFCKPVRVLQVSLAPAPDGAVALTIAAPASAERKLSQGEPGGDSSDVAARARAELALSEQLLARMGASVQVLGSVPGQLTFRMLWPAATSSSDVPPPA